MHTRSFHRTQRLFRSRFGDERISLAAICSDCNCGVYAFQFKRITYRIDFFFFESLAANERTEQMKFFYRLKCRRVCGCIDASVCACVCVCAPLVIAIAFIDYLLLFPCTEWVHFLCVALIFNGSFRTSRRTVHMSVLEWNHNQAALERNCIVYRCTSHNKHFCIRLGKIILSPFSLSHGLTLSFYLISFVIWT